MNAITAVQKAVLIFIGSELRRCSMAPTHRELAKHFGWTSNSAVRCHLLGLEKKGFIKTKLRIPRHVEILSAGQELINAEAMREWGEIETLVRTDPGTLGNPVRLDFAEQPLSDQLWLTREGVTQAAEFGKCRLVCCVVPADEMPLKFTLELFGHELHWEQYQSDALDIKPDADCIAQALQAFAHRIHEGEIR